ncbi:type II toxin-antitoxin system RelE/ParE family toxin [Candidatus Uhrbacteria bacterium]|nr:type II toxin-antitoxin system RelE/ParE family toxin [Candidatus Uhrbacteria bacterium]
MKIRLLRQPFKFLQKAKTPLQSKIVEELKRIAGNPKIGKTLTGKLKLVRSHKFTSAGVQYRIAYQIRGDVIVILIASRENFYRDLQI